MYKCLAVLLIFQKQYIEGNTPIKLFSELAFLTQEVLCISP